MLLGAKCANHVPLEKVPKIPKIDIERGHAERVFGTFGTLPKFTSANGHPD